MCHLFAHEPQRGALLVAQIAGARMPLPLPSRPMVRRCSSSNVRPATSRTIQAGSARSVAVQDRRQAGRQGGRLPLFGHSRRPTSPGTTPGSTANPEAIIPGDIVAYRQPKAETRAAIIAYLKELN